MTPSVPLPLAVDRVAGDDAEGTKGAAVFEAHVGAGVFDFDMLLAVVLDMPSSVVPFDCTGTRGAPVGMLAEIACNGRWIGPGPDLY